MMTTKNKLRDRGRVSIRAIKYGRWYQWWIWDRRSEFSQIFTLGPPFHSLPRYEPITKILFQITDLNVSKTADLHQITNLTC